MLAGFITDPVPPARQVGDFHLYLNFTTDVLQRAKPFFDLLYNRITGKVLPRSKSTVHLIRCMCEALIGAGARLRDGLEDSRRHLHLSPERVQAVVELGLQLAERPGLRPFTLPDGAAAFMVPPLTGSWAPCLDGLEHPHTRQLRPIVFDADRAAGRDDVVLAHLGHRLVQMCLRLLRAEVWAPDDFRRTNPRFMGENFQKNLDLVEAVKAIAADRGVTAAQLALAWVLAQGDDLIPIPGTRRVATLEQNVAAVDLALTPQDLARIDAVFPKGAAVGHRYAEAARAALNR
jgi:hypothetical protein